MIRNPLLIPDIRELLQEGEGKALVEFFSEMHPARVAEMLEDLEPAEGDAVFDLLDPRSRAAVMSYLNLDRQVYIIEQMEPAEAAELLHLMSHDDRADLVKRLDLDQVDEILRRLAHAEREDIRRLVSYEPGTAGSAMTTDYATLSPHKTVREALDQLRHEAPDRETIDYSYVIDAHRKLMGMVALKKLILARPQALVEEIMARDIVIAKVDEDQESVVRKIEKFDLATIPVLDVNDTLVGIITHDDAIDILRREQTADIFSLAGIAKGPDADEDVPYWQNRVTSAFSRRIWWLLLLFLGENLTYPVMRYYGWIARDFHTLDFFIPLLIGTGGNAGSQTVSTVIRGLSLGQIEKRQALLVILREWFIGLLLGAALGLSGAFYAWWWRKQPIKIAVVVGTALLGICMWANTVGALVPLLAKRFGKDPAIVSAPLISTLVDATGLIIYFSIAIALLIKLG